MVKATDPTTMVKTRTDLLRQLGTDKNSNVRAAVAANPACPSDVKLLLAKDDSEYVLQMLALHAILDFDLIKTIFSADILSDAKSLFILEVRRNPYIPQELKSKFDDLQQEIERRQGQTLSAYQVVRDRHVNLSHIITYLDEKIVGVADRNKAIPVKTDSTICIKINFSDEDWSKVLKSKNPIALGIFSMLGSSDEKYFGALFEAVMKTEGWAAKVPLALSKNLSDDQMRALAKDKEGLVKQALASNPDCPADVLIKFSKSKDASLRTIVANPMWFEIPPFLATNIASFQEFGLQYLKL